MTPVRDGSALPAPVIAAYRAAEYRVRAEPAFVLRVDEPSPALAALHAAHAVGCSAFLTAWNPRGTPAPAAENTAAAARLEAALRERGLALVAGRGIDPAGEWGGEESVLALGLGRSEACAVGREFGQNAILWAAGDAVPRLVLLR
jgi:hypothetical protein